MKMIKYQLDKDEEKDIAYWNRISENTEKDKLASFIRENYKLNWVSSTNTTLIPANNTLIFQHPNSMVKIYKKGAYSIPNDSVTVQVNGKSTQITSNDRNINQKLRTRSKDDNDLMVYLKDKKILTTWFDAWRYEQEKSLPIIALIRTITLAIDDYLADYEESDTWKHARKSLKRSAVAFLQSSKISLDTRELLQLKWVLKSY